MYQTLKKIISKIVSKKFLYKNEFFFRNLYALAYSGNSHQCNICEKKLSKFVINQRHELLCPKCGSLGRDRRLWKLLKTDYLKENYTVLDFSPSRSLSHKLKKENSINYLSTDLSGNFNADFEYDITKIDMSSNTIDLIICYHILEHIDEDLLAMSELFRVLKPNGIAIIQTPFTDGDIYENPLIQSPEERLKHFGQEDHVRIYSEIELKNRLEKTGFDVTIRHFDKIENYNKLLENESVFVVKKV
ncbi:Methyltransferase domain-containing protein [Flavobacterium swingsii]|uniref:Methyltransferase domain-containing protein n=1 Tax=Flavobacterium swingsii TaxID=498292 RepID=A0A1I0WJK6_9FLAO|nr:Methyltransferase domain-containing protein [Flavobacterium swingsii]